MASEATMAGECEYCRTAGPDILATALRGDGGEAAMGLFVDWVPSDDGLGRTWLLNAYSKEDGTVARFGIAFCPMCGRSLGEAAGSKD